MMRIIVLFILFISTTSSVFCSNWNSFKNPLIIFHIDLNSVSLKENYIRKWIKKTADMGYNAILWEVENEVQWKTCPECVSPDAFSKQTFRDILKYSRELGLEPIPLLQTIGHAEYVLSCEKYITLREDLNRYDCYCTSNPDVRKFLKDWIREYLELFGNIRYFHLGGDEAYAFGTCPVCAQRAKEIGENHLYAEYMTDIAQPLLENGIRPSIWCDMILKNPEEINAIPKDFVIWDWNYWDGDEIPQQVMVWSKGRNLKKDEITEDIRNMLPEIIDDSGNLRSFYIAEVLKRLGYEVILCSSSRSYGDGVFAGRHYVHAPNIIGAAKKTIEAGLLGTCVTSWAIRIPNYETQEPWLYLVPLTIKNSELSRQELLAKTAEHVFGVKNDEFFKAISLIGISFPFANNKTTGIQWTNLKDSRPAPEGFIRDLIEKWKTSNDEKEWLSNTKIIKGTSNKIRNGIFLLNKFIPKANKGFEVLNAWSKAEYFQYWSAQIANEIVDRTNGNSQSSPDEIVELIKEIRADYLHWSNTWMTPHSAEVNTGLIFDAIIEYFSEQ